MEGEEGRRLPYRWLEDTVFTCLSCAIMYVSQMRSMRNISTHFAVANRQRSPNAQPHPPSAAASTRHMGRGELGKTPAEGHLQTSTGVAPAILPMSSSVCMIFLIRDMGNRVLYFLLIVALLCVSLCSSSKPNTQAGHHPSPRGQSGDMKIDLLSQSFNRPRSYLDTSQRSA